MKSVSEIILDIKRKKIIREKEKQVKELEKLNKLREIGTRKVFLAILSEILKDKSSNLVSIECIEFTDSSNNFPFVYHINKTNKKGDCTSINIGKTYINPEQLNIYLNNYGLTIMPTKQIQYDITTLGRASTYFSKEIEEGKRSVRSTSRIWIGERCVVFGKIDEFNLNNLEEEYVKKIVTTTVTHVPKK